MMATSNNCNVCYEVTKDKKMQCCASFVCKKCKLNLCRLECPFCNQLMELNSTQKLKK